MVRRRAGEVFGDSYAFPGGILDDDEALAREFCQGRTADEANKLLGVREGGLDYFSAATRELFEETGILLARAGNGGWALEGDSGTQADIGTLRKRIDRGSLRWSEFLRDKNFRIACDALHYFAHWETPLSRQPRWSARFFLAEMPAGPDARHDGSELTDSRWLSAAAALGSGREGGMRLPFPTFRNLGTLAQFESVADLVCWAKERARSGVEKIRPVELSINGEPKFVIRGDADYPKDGER